MRSSQSRVFETVTLAVLTFCCLAELFFVVDGFSNVPSLNQHAAIWKNKSVMNALPEFAARNLVRELVEDEMCYSSLEGVQKLLDACESNVVYQDGTQVNPIVGKSNVGSYLNNNKNYHQRRLDKISDGTNACGFTWTWVTDTEEGLRGTTFVQLNPASGQIQYVCELAEPLYKPGDGTVDFFKLITKDYEPLEEEQDELIIRTPTTASDIASYMFTEIRGRNMTETLRFYENDITYQDFNYESSFHGIPEVKNFLEKFTSIKGVTFTPIQFDDGITSSCFLWKVQIMDAPDDILGISFYETNPETGKICFIRDIPESAIKPPPLGTLARNFRPTLGVFTPKPLGSRPFGIS